MAQYRVRCQSCPFTIIFADETPIDGMPAREQWNACSAAMGALKSHERTDEHTVEMTRVE